MARRRSSRRSQKTPTLILVLVSAVALIAAFGLWKAWSCVREYQASLHAYDELIIEAAGRNGIDPNLVKAVIWRESRFRPYVKGSSGEIGLMQIMPDKAAVDWAKRNGQPVPSKGALYSPRLNIEIGSWYLAKALRRWSAYRDQLVLALCEYNAGITRASAWKPVDKNGDVRSRITIASTLSYVNSILAKYDEYKKTWIKDQPQNTGKKKK